MRLLSVTGPPGVGKTRLALALARTCSGDFADGGSFVALAPIDDARLVAATIARAVGVGEAGAVRAFERLVLWLKQKQFLILLDNFEQVLRAAPLLSELLAACPSLKVMVTSRARLQLSGEHELPLAPLEVPDPAVVSDPRALRRYASVALFCERARAARPDFDLHPGNARAVVEICAQVDGLPLALELAAARVRLLAADALRSRLVNRLELLTGGPRDLPARQRTLRNTIAWSHELLDESERRVFRRLGVFAGGFTVEAAEAVATDASQRRSALDDLNTLLDSNLIRQIDPAADARLTMLETIREYALERLAESGDEEATRSVHASFYLDLAEEAEPRLTSAEQERWLQQLELEHDNLRAALRLLLDSGRAGDALRLAAALSRFWVEHGHLSEGEHWLRDALASADDPPLLQARALCGAGMIAHDQGRYVEATELCREAAERSLRAGDLRAHALALTTLAFVAAKEGDFDRARDLYATAVSACRDVGEPWLVAHVLERFGTAVWMGGDNATATACFEESLSAFERLGDRREAAFATASLGAVALADSDHERALSLLEPALLALREGSNPRYVAQMLLHVGQANIDRGDTSAASAAFSEVLALARPRGIVYGIILALSGIARIATTAGSSYDAVRLFAAADAALERVSGVMPEYMRQRADEGLRRARASLDPADVDAALADGRRLTVDEAVELAERVAAAARVSGALTAREREVLDLVAERLSDREIAKQLVVSVRTVHAHLRAIYRKLGVNSRADAVEQGLELQLVTRR